MSNLREVNAIRMIISGGQSGVDRAALDFAREVGLPYGGYVPRGGRAEDYRIPPGLLADYPEMREHSSREWQPRTTANIRHSGATLVVIDSRRVIGPGTKLTIRLAKELEKPLLQLDVRDPDPFDTARVFLNQFDAPIALNVAGSRESTSGGIYVATKRMLHDVLTNFLAI